MQRIDPTVLRETRFIALVVLIFSAIMEAVYLVIGCWNIHVLLGNLLGALAAVANFFLMGLSIQSALGMEEKAAKSRMKLSQRLRFLMLIVVAVLGVALKCFDTIATIVPLFFPRIGILFRPLLDKKGENQ